VANTERIVESLIDGGFVAVNEKKKHVVELVQVALDVAPSLMAEKYRRTVLGTWVSTQLALSDDGNYRGLLSGIKELAEIEAIFTNPKNRLSEPEKELIRVALDEHCCDRDDYEQLCKKVGIAL
jgi:hypothetical protein